MLFTQAVKSIDTTWADNIVDISGLVPGKSYIISACMHKYTDNTGKERPEKCFMHKKTAVAAGRRHSLR